MRKHWRAIAVLGVGLLVAIYPLIFAGISAVVSWFPTTNQCGLGFSPGPCHYNPGSGAINFSLGEAAAALGLILAVLQLLDPAKRLALRLNRRLKITGIVLLCIGFAAILISSTIVSLPGNYKLVSFPIFWETIGYICLISAPLIYYRASTKITGLFKPKRASAENFYRTLINAVAAGQPTNIEAVSRILVANADEIMKAIKAISPHTTHFPFRSQEMPENLEYAKYANDLVRIILSEQKVANFFATQHVDWLFRLLSSIKKHDLTNASVMRGTEKIFEELYEDKNSHLYNQLEFDGLTLYAPIYNFLFGDKELFFVRELNILNRWNRYDLANEVRYTENYAAIQLKALEIAIKAYGFRDSSPMEQICHALAEIPEYAENVVTLDDKNEREKLSVTSNRKILMKIERFLGSDFPKLYKEALDSGTVSDYEQEARANDSYYASLTATYGKTLAKYFEIFAWQETKTDWQIRHELISATQDVLSLHDTGGTYTNIRNRFFETIWEQIKDNVEQGHYPVVIRHYIQLFDWDNSKSIKWRKDERNKLFGYMKNELAPRLLKEEKMLDGEPKETVLLPEDMTFSKSSKRFYHRNEQEPIAWSVK